MSRFIETIRLQDGVFYNLFQHEQRMRRTLQYVHGEGDVNLEELLDATTRPDSGLYKCRVVYDEVERQIEFVPYEARRVASLKLVEDNYIQYEFKYQNRDRLNKLFSHRNDCDDVLIIKKGMVTDTSYANVAFKRGKEWITPWNCLLRGTMRQKLLDENVIKEELITLKDIGRFESVKLINSMLGFDAPEIEISKIIV